MVINAKHIISALPLIASILGRKYGVRVEIGGDHAYTDGKIIHLPSLPTDGDATLLGLAKGFIDHESAHLRATDFDLVKQAKLTPLEKHVWNMLEDYVAEHKLAAIYPGCRHNLNWLLKHLFVDEHESNQGIDPGVQLLNWMLLKIRSWDLGEIGLCCDLAAKDVDEHFPGLLPKLEVVLNTVPSKCQNTKDCITTAHELVKLLQQHQVELEEQEQRQQDDQQSNADQNGEGEDGSSAEQGQNSPVKQNSSQASQSLQALIGAGDNELPKDIGQELAEKLGAQHAQPHGDKISVAIATGKHLGSGLINLDKR